MNADHYYKLGEASLKDNNYKEALSHFLKAIELKLDFANAHSLLGRTYYFLNNHEKAIESYLKAKEYGSNIIPIYIQAGQHYIQNGDLKNAINCIQIAKKITPREHNFTNYVKLGNIYLVLASRMQRSQNADQVSEISRLAIQEFEKALELNPDAISRALLGIACIQQGKMLKTNSIDYYNKAVKNFKYGIETNKFGEVILCSIGFSKVYYLLAAEVMSKKQDIVKFQEYLYKSMKYANNITIAFQIYILCQKFFSKEEDIVKSFEKAIELYPKSNHYYSALAIAHFRSKDYKKAIAYQRAAVRMDPHNWINQQLLDMFVDNHEFLDNFFRMNFNFMDFL